MHEALELISRARIGAAAPIVSTVSPSSPEGFIAGPTAALAAGASLYFHGPFDSAGFLALLDRLGPSHLIVPAALAADLQAAGVLTPSRLASLICVGKDGGGAVESDIPVHHFVLAATPAGE